MKNYSFAVRSQPCLEISAFCNVAVSPSRDENVYVEVDGSEDDVKQVRVSQSGDTISIKDESSSGGGQTIIQNGRTVMSFSGGNVSNISMVNGNIHIGGNSGSVYINGKRVDLGGNTQSEDYKPLQIVVYSPVADIELDLKGAGRLASSQNFDKAYVGVQGSGQVVLTARDLEISASGSSDVTAQILGGSLEISSSGSSDITVNGNFEKAKVSSSGSSDITTIGTCSGDYIATASGSSDITHRGRILGKTRERASGSADINL